jgi:protein-S-isoprenylcysteine O-methyltransferase Ste14
LVKQYAPFIKLNRSAELIIAAIAAFKGLYFLIWATITQWKNGSGTPAPNAPTQSLITAGPYKICRNPIQLGATLYYLSFGTFFAK